MGTFAATTSVIINTQDCSACILTVQQSKNRQTVQKKALQSFETSENTRPKRECLIPKTSSATSHCELASVTFADYVPISLRYKPHDRGFDSRWGHWDFSLT